MQSLLYEVRAHDPLTFIAVPAAIVLVTFAASVVPALRAVRVSPVTALRME
jgi:putative ABC transport system permease protein